MDIERLKVLLNRIPYLGLVIGWCLWQYWGYYEFTQPNSGSAYAMKLNQLRSVKTQNEQLQKKIVEGTAFNKSLEKKREELRALAKRLSEMKTTLSEELDVPKLIKMVITEAKRLRITVKKFSPEPQKTQEFYIAQPFRLEFRGLWTQLIAFFVRISNAQNIIKVGNMDLTPLGSQTSRFVQLEGSIQLLAFRYNGSAADEIAKSREAKPASGQKKKGITMGGGTQ